MASQVLHKFRRLKPDQELCFNVELSAPLTVEEMGRLEAILKGLALSDDFGPESFLPVGVVGIGPRLNFETTMSSNIVAICQACGLPQVTRVEVIKYYTVSDDVSADEFFAGHGDRMIERLYFEPLTSFATDIQPKPVRIIPLQERGIQVLQELSATMGLALDAWDMKYLVDVFVRQYGRNPTDVELFAWAQANSEHCRHKVFNGRLIIEGETMPRTLMEMVKRPYELDPGNSIISFGDNASASRGFEIGVLVSEYPGRASRYIVKQRTRHITSKAETHNHPSTIAPPPGAQTCLGGWERDKESIGRGGEILVATAGYAVAALHILDYPFPWENHRQTCPSNIASSLEILIGASDGMAIYANQSGVPLGAGWFRSFDHRLPSGQRVASLKATVYGGGLGMVDDAHITKGQPEVGMLVVMFGGPAFRIGMGGASGSSQVTGSNDADLDCASVQRGDGKVAQQIRRVVSACVALEKDNPIVSIHDQGAGGENNVIIELVHPAGARINMRKTRLGDQTLSVLEILSAEYQERLAVLLRPESLSLFASICEHEEVSYEVLGEIMGDGKIVVYDEQDDTTPVNMELRHMLGTGQKEFVLHRVPIQLDPLQLPSELTIAEALKLVLMHPDVASNLHFLVKADRSVGGLMTQQSCVGPLQLPVADCCVTALGFSDDAGAVVSIGERLPIMVLDPKAGVGLALAEAILNLVGALTTGLADIGLLANWMWAFKCSGEGALLYDAVEALSQALIENRLPTIRGGKDSLSMAVIDGDEVVPSPRQLIIQATGAIPDVAKVVTSDIKHSGSSLLFVDLANGRRRLGGSVLARVHNQLGDIPPDVEDWTMFVRAFQAVQKLVAEGLIQACHDRSDGGLIVTLLEMAFAGNCGLELALSEGCTEQDMLSYLFTEELGLVLEVQSEHKARVSEIFQEFGLLDCLVWIGSACQNKLVAIWKDGRQIFKMKMQDLRAMWSETSYRLDALQANPDCVKAAQEAAYDQQNPRYIMTFTPRVTPAKVLKRKRKPKAAILRAQGTSGDKELAEAFRQAGFEVFDVMMSALLKGQVTLEEFQMLACAGGFSYADVTDSANGWASVIRHNEQLSMIFDEYRRRPDTLSLGVCNGCQLLTLLGWVFDEGVHSDRRPRFMPNTSGRFESRWSMMHIPSSRAVVFHGMEGSVLGAWVAHGEGRAWFPDEGVIQLLRDQQTLSLFYADAEGMPTESYPFNPNGSPLGIAGFCSPDGRHTAIMPHPLDRGFQVRQWAYVPPELRSLQVSPWLRMSQNARAWFDEHC